MQIVRKGAFIVSIHLLRSKFLDLLLQVARGLRLAPVLRHQIDRRQRLLTLTASGAALEARLQQMDMRIDVAPEALAEIAKVGFDPVFGARPLKRAIQQRIENPLSKLILQGKFGPKDVIPVTVNGEGQFVFERTVH